MTSLIAILIIKIVFIFFILCLGYSLYDITCDLIWYDSIQRDYYVEFFIFCDWIKSNSVSNRKDKIKYIHDSL